MVDKNREMIVYFPKKMGEFMLIASFFWLPVLLRCQMFSGFTATHLTISDKNTHFKAARHSLSVENNIDMTDT